MGELETGGSSRACVECGAPNTEFNLQCAGCGTVLPPSTPAAPPRPSGPELTEGSFFAGRYRVGPALARGGMGSVHEAVHLETGRRCALKVLLPHVVHDEDARRRFRREARVAARIGSDHIVEVLDAGVDETTAMPFLVMELL